MEFLQTPNLPEADVALVAMSGTYQSIVNAIIALGIQVIEIRPCKALDKPVSSHADMLIHPLGNKRIVVESGEEYLKHQFIQNGFDVLLSNICVSSAYPHDVLFNAGRIGNQLIANVSSLDLTIIRYCAENQIQIIPVKQGYAKCSIIVVDDHSIITADQSIAEAASVAGIDVLIITQGAVELPGYNYGFLGGACGMIGKHVLAFTGNIQVHPDYLKIKNYCSSKKVELLSLTNTALIDIGGIIPLKTKCK